MTSYSVELHGYIPITLSEYTISKYMAKLYSVFLKVPYWTLMSPTCSFLPAKILPWNSMHEIRRVWQLYLNCVNPVRNLASYLALSWNDVDYESHKNLVWNLARVLQDYSFKFSLYFIQASKRDLARILYLAKFLLPLARCTQGFLVGYGQILCYTQKPCLNCFVMCTFAAHIIYWIMNVIIVP